MVPFILIICPLFFLFWAFLLSTITHLLPKIPEKTLYSTYADYPKKFFYFPIHKWLFKSDLYDLFILASSLGTNGARMGFISFAFFALYKFFPQSDDQFIIVTLLLFFITLLVTELISRLIALRASLRFFHIFLLPTSLFLTLSLLFQFWILKIIERRKRKMRKEMGEDRVEKFREIITDLVQAADVTAPLQPSEKKLLEAVLKFKDRIVREVMIPRTQLFTLPTTTTLKEAATKLTEEGYSRIPIYRGNIDNIIGVLMFKDLFEIYKQCLEGGSDLSILSQPIGDFVKGVIYSPETKQVSQLLQEFRAKQLHMAIVVNEYGGTEGVVTIEDLLEEIVGEISDEYDIDHDAPYLPQAGGGVWIVDAKMNIYDAENTFNIQIPKEGDYDTIGGFIYHKLNALPEPKTKIICDGFELEILSVTERSVSKVRLITRQENR